MSTKRLNSIISKSRKFCTFLSTPDWIYKDFLDGQSNYAFNIILKEPNKVLLKNYVMYLMKIELNIV